MRSLIDSATRERLEGFSGNGGRRVSLQACWSGGMAALLSGVRNFAHAHVLGNSQNLNSETPRKVRQSIFVSLLVGLA